MLLGSVAKTEIRPVGEEIAIFKGGLKRYAEQPSKLVAEDLCAIVNLSEATVLETLKMRLSQRHAFTFAGDVLISLNSNDQPTEYPKSLHQKYISKTQSENAPHIFAVADRAHQDMLHHEDPQFIVLSGETFSGKTTMANHLVNHLCLIGEGNKGADHRVRQSMVILNALIHAGTPLNRNSTRAIFMPCLTFGKTGKLSGVIQSIYLLEKSRVSSTDM